MSYSHLQHRRTMGDRSKSAFKTALLNKDSLSAFIYVVNGLRPVPVSVNKQAVYKLCGDHLRTLEYIMQRDTVPADHLPLWIIDYTFELFNYLITAADPRHSGANEMSDENEEGEI